MAPIGISYGYGYALWLWLCLWLCLCLDNWKARRDKMTAAMNMHSARSLSLRGKSLLIQSVICTKLWFIGAIIPLPRGIAKGLQSSIFNFLWHNKPESVRRTVMYADYADGGMKIINIAGVERIFLTNKAMFA